MCSMLKIVMSKRFERDLKSAKKRQLDLSLLSRVINLLAAQQPLPSACRDHFLSGKYADFKECHIKPDWLLIYSVDGKKLCLFLFRTGSHSDLFE